MIILFFVVVAIVGPSIAPYDYTAYARDIAAHMNALIEKTAVKEQTAAFSIFEGESVR